MEGLRGTLGGSLPLPAKPSELGGLQEGRYVWGRARGTAGPSWTLEEGHTFLREQDLYPLGHETYVNLDNRVIPAYRTPAQGRQPQEEKAGNT